MTDKTDHQRGCAGREYTCTCGYDEVRDNRLEAFKQEVSDAVEQADLLDLYGKAGAYLRLQRFIIAKPDPLVEVIAQIGWGNGWDDETDYARQLRAALEARGLEIREKGE
jgi:hypothetical protein